MKWILVASFLIGCRGESTDFIKHTLAETRQKTRVNVQVRLEKSELPSPQELDQQRKMESDIEQQAIGSVVRSESGVGYYDFTVEVDDSITAIPRLRALLANAGVLQHSTIKIVSP
ncbi:MAG TPA: hypothetical protein VER58_12705 [Thermoanaerobaculia bacterium]|nr:hypothetical protein [Thermoanaerobaculia bacterium]